MADSNTQLHWTDEQWNKVRQVVYEEARKARVAGNLLPLYGPLESDATYVRRQKLVRPNSGNEEGEDIAAFTVSDTATIRLPTLQVKVYLRNGQVADPELSSALIAFRRAANVLARLEDEIIFNGQEAEGRGPNRAGRGRGLPNDDLWEVRGGQATDGLLPAATRPARPVAREPEPLQQDALAYLGNALVSTISQAIGRLEADYQLGPFACVLDQTYFAAVQTANEDSLVLPQDRILPFLGGGALVRSSTLRDQTGLVIALGGAPIDLVVGTDISVGFLQVTEDPYYVFRVYEKVVLRIKQPQAIQYIAPYGPVVPR
jgi:uncharacterized linocin/CFP29 family protein